MADNTEKLVTLSNLSDHIEEIKRILKQVRAFIDKKDDTKVDKVDGKGLSSNDYTAAEKNKLATLKNYDDSALVAQVKALEQSLNTLVGDNASEAIDNFNEILRFLSGITDTQTLEGMLANIREDMQTYLSQKVDKESGKQLSTNDYTTAEKNKLAGIEAGAQKNTVTGIKGNAESSYRTGNVNLTPANIGAAAASHSHAISDVDNLQTTLDGKAAKSHTHSASEITDFTTKVKTLQAADILSAEPTESTTTHTVNGVSVAYQIGELVCVPDSESETGFKFFQLHAVTDGKAVWAAVRTGSGDTDTGKSFGIEWSLDDTVKTINYVGDVELVEYFKKWVDESPRPCEISKDLTDFAYLTNIPGVASNVNWQTREDGTPSHYDTSDKADYLQMVEMQNINIMFKTDNVLKKMSVWFNFDKECPSGYHRWFKGITKLFCRYNPTKNGDGYDIAKGLSLGSDWSMSAELHLSRCKNTGNGIYSETFWEILVLDWIQVAYYKTFDIQSTTRGGGLLQKSSLDYAFTYINGTEDVLTSPHGSVDGNFSGYRFMYRENCSDGVIYIFGIGTLSKSGYAYIMYDEDKAQESALIDISKANAKIKLESITQWEGFIYPKNIDYFGIPLDNEGSSSSGVLSASFWRINDDSSVIVVGGDVATTEKCGIFTKAMHIGYNFVQTNRRGLCTIKR